MWRGRSSLSGPWIRSGIPGVVLLGHSSASALTVSAVCSGRQSTTPHVWCCRDPRLGYPSMMRDPKWGTPPTLELSCDMLMVVTLGWVHYSACLVDGIMPYTNLHVCGNTPTLMLMSRSVVSHAERACAISSSSSTTSTFDR